MGRIPSRDEALALLRLYNKEAFHLRHAEVVEGVMADFAKEYDPENTHFWAMAGLLHDLDYERWPDEHCLRTADIMREQGYDEALIRAVVSHGYGHHADTAPESFMEKALYAVDELTGLIGAAVLMRPGGVIDGMEPKSVKKKFKDKRFAAGCSRDVIERGAHMLGWTLDELIARTLAAMQRLTPAG